MQEFLKMLLNIRSLRAALRDLPFEQVQEAHEKFELVYLERKTQVDKEKAGDASGVNSSEKKKRAPRPPKYRYVVDGNEQTWTGQGRTPKHLAEQIAQGRSLDDFLI